MDVCEIFLVIISPLGTSLILEILALALAVFGFGGRAFIFGFIGLVWLLTWSLPIVSDSVRSHVEHEFPQPSIQSLPYEKAAIVLCGGMHASANRLDDPCLNSVACLLTAAGLYHAGKAPLLVLSTGNREAVLESWVMRAKLCEFGVPDEKIVLEAASRTANESARFSSRLLRNRNIKTAFLITSALHMGRALRFYSHEGVRMIPVATGQKTYNIEAWRSLMPDASVLEVSAYLIREWLGQRLPLYKPQYYQESSESAYY